MEQKILKYFEVLPTRYHEEFKKEIISSKINSPLNLQGIFEEYLERIVNDLSPEEQTNVIWLLYGNAVNNDASIIDLGEVLRIQNKRYYENITKLKDEEFTIISSNCIGGVIYHNLRLEFKSPTINLFFYPSDFIKFGGNLEYYLNCELEECNTNENYPVARLDDVLLYGLHYGSFEELKLKWDSRKKRVCYDKLFFIMSERDGCVREDILNFDELPYDNKIIFVHEPLPEVESAYCIPDTSVIENGEIVVVPLTGFKKDENMRFIDYFDYVSFLNKGL